MEHRNTESQQFSASERAFLKAAAEFFENPGIFEKGLSFFSTPIEVMQSKLPAVVLKHLASASRSAIEHALVLSLKTISPNSLDSELIQAQEKSKSIGSFHSRVASVLGGVGGFFGLLVLPVELPLATIIMLRSIAEIARQHGVNLNSPEAKLDCLYILSLGGGSKGPNTLESEYYTSRLVFAEILSGASSFIAAHTTRDILAAIENRTAPALLRLIGEIAARFQIQVTRKLFAQMTPLVGAMGGAGMNLMFANYYNTCSRFHFGLRALEKIHGINGVRKEFEKYRIDARLK